MDREWLKQFSESNGWGWTAGLLVIALLVPFAFITFIVLFGQANLTDPYKIPTLAASGLLFFIAILTVAAVIFKLVGLGNKDQAMGLPEGSIRAVLALGLLLSFVTISVYWHNSLSLTPLAKIEALTTSEKDRAQTALGSRVVKVQQTTPGTGATARFTIFYEPNPAAVDFAKQGLTALINLLTAVVSFYFGAQTTRSAALAGGKAALAGGKAATDAASHLMTGPSPTITAVTPNKGQEGTTVPVTITGTNLSRVVKVFLSRPNSTRIEATGVTSSATTVKCDVTLASGHSGTWDLEAEQSDGSTATPLPQAFTVTT